MRPMPIRYVRDMDAARRFYQALGLAHDFTSRTPRRGPPVWTELSSPRGGIALHHAPDGSGLTGLQMSFQSDEPLEQVAGRLRAAGFDLATQITDESYGRSFTIYDPEGLLIHVNENDYDLQR